MKRFIPLGIILWASFSMAFGQSYWTQFTSCSPTFSNPCGAPQTANCQSYLGNVDGWQFNIDGPTGKLWRAPVNTSNWVEVFDFAPVPVYEKCISANAAGMLLVNGVDGSSGFQPRLWLSLDYGTTWTEVTGSIGSSNVPNSIDVYPTADGFELKQFYYAAYGLNYRWEYRLNPLVGWANVQYPGSATIDECGAATVYAQVWGENHTAPTTGGHPQMKAWIGWSDQNTDPSSAGWNWVPATFNADLGNNDEYRADLSGLPAGNYHFASRFQVGTSGYAYGGYSGSGGDFWGTNGAGSGSLTVQARTQDPGPTVGWGNLQWPTAVSITSSESVDYFGRAWMAGRTDAPGAGAGIKAWLGTYSCGAGCSGVQPTDAAWTWTPMAFHADFGNDDEYSTRLEGADLAPGQYLTLVRYQADCGPYSYAGTQGFWAGASGYGSLEVTAPASKQAGTPATGKDIYLSPNFPNPFGETTRIDYRVDGALGSASLRILDLRGQVHREITLGASTGTIEIAAADLPSGIYLYQLVVDGNASAPRKMVVQ